MVDRYPIEWYPNLLPIVASAPGKVLRSSYSIASSAETMNRPGNDRRHTDRGAGAFGPIQRCVIKVARQPLPGDAVALEIAEMGTCALEALPRQLDQPGLDDDTPRSKGGIAIARCQHAADAGAAANAAALEGTDS